jgi:hypothetical protein
MEQHPTEKDLKLYSTLLAQKNQIPLLSTIKRIQTPPHPTNLTAGSVQLNFSALPPNPDKY